MVINSRNTIIIISTPSFTMHASFFPEFFFSFVFPKLLATHNVTVDERNDHVVVVKGGWIGCTSSDYPRVVSKGTKGREGGYKSSSKEVPPPGGKHNRGQQRGCHLHGNSRARDASKFSLVTGEEERWGRKGWMLELMLIKFADNRCTSVWLDRLIICGIG